jgi:hypothetical protein
MKVSSSLKPKVHKLSGGKNDNERKSSDVEVARTGRNHRAVVSFVGHTFEQGSKR